MAVAVAAAGDWKQQPLMDQLDERLIMCDLKEPEESGLGCYYQNEKAFAVVALPKGELGQKVPFAAAGDGSKIEKEPVAWTVELGLNQSQDISLDLALSA